MTDSESDKNRATTSEKAALESAGRDSAIEQTQLDSQADPNNREHIQNMQVLANQDSPSDLSLKCPDLSTVERERIANNRFELVDSLMLVPDTLDSAQLMAITADSDPSMLPVSLLRQYADSLPNDHPDKSRLTDLSRQQAAELSPEFADRYDRADGSILLDIGVSKANLPPQNWFEAAQQIGELPIEKQFEVIGTALSEGFKQYSYEERERSIGQIIGTVQGIGDALYFYAAISEFAWEVISHNKPKLQDRGLKIYEALGKTYVGGVSLFNLAYDYCYNIGFEGDYYKPFRDVVSLANAMDTKWKMLPPREQERIKAQLVTNLLADGVITAGGAKTISQSPRITKILHQVAQDAKAAGVALKDVSGRAADHIAATLDDISKFPPGSGALRPAYGYAGEGFGFGGMATGSESPKGFKQKLDDFMNAMGRDKKVEDASSKKKDLKPARTERDKDYSWLDPYCESIEKDAPDVIQQKNINACGFACIEMASGGKLEQGKMLERYIAESHPQLLEKCTTKAGECQPLADLPWISKILGPPWVSNKFRKDLTSEERFSFMMSKKEPWITDFKKADHEGHIVMIDGLNENGMVIVRDPGDKTKYLMSQENFKELWTGNCVFKEFD